MDQAKLFEEDVCPVSKIIWLTCEDEAVLIERILSRGRLSGRADDNAESVAERLKTFKENTAPILEFYQGRNDGKLALLDASLSPDEVFNNVKLVLDHF
jgi:UMP-CMP kinase